MVQLDAALSEDVKRQLLLAIEAFRRGDPVCVFDSARREQETDILYPAITLAPEHIRRLRRDAGGMIFMAVAHDICELFGLPFLQDLYAESSVTGRCPLLSHLVSNDIPYDARSAFSLTLNHRDTFTGVTDHDRSLTGRRFAELSREVMSSSKSSGGSTGGGGGGGGGGSANGSNVNGHMDRVKGDEPAAVRLGKEFRSPGHIPLCREKEGGVLKRQGHTELSLAVARLAGVVPVVVGAEMMDPEGDNALPLEKARAWAAAHNIPFLEGQDIVSATLAAAAK